MIEFVKMHVAGNDFLVVESTHPGLDWPAAARALCARRFGVGSDGLMVIELGGGERPSVRMFNPDGSEDVCGNGMLCVAVFLREKGAVEDDEFAVNSLDGPKVVRLEAREGGAPAARINMGRARFDPRLIPALCDKPAIINHPLDAGGAAFEISALTTGTSHAIIFADALPDDGYFFKWAPRIECHPMFPRRTSVTWAVVASRDRVVTRVWERGGVGESLSCGTGACAVAAVTSRLKLTGPRVVVCSRGGELTVETDKNGHMWLGATPQTVFTGRAPLSLKQAT